MKCCEINWSILTKPTDEPHLDREVCVGFFSSFFFVNTPVVRAYMCLCADVFVLRACHRTENLCNYVKKKKKTVAAINGGQRAVVLDHLEAHY